jgi:hypothetical protein
MSLQKYDGWDWHNGVLEYDCVVVLAQIAASKVAEGVRCRLTCVMHKKKRITLTRTPARVRGVKRHVSRVIHNNCDTATPVQTEQGQPATHHNKAEE